MFPALNTELLGVDLFRGVNRIRIRFVIFMKHKSQFQDCTCETLTLFRHLSTHGPPYVPALRSTRGARTKLMLPASAIEYSSSIGLFDVN